MTSTKKILRTISGILLAALAIYLGKAFWQYFMLSFMTPFGILVSLICIGYIYIVIDLTKLKKRAVTIFITIILSAIFIEIPFVMILEEGNVMEGLWEWFFVMFFWVSLIVIPVFGISALIRKILKKSKL